MSHHDEVDAWDRWHEGLCKQIGRKYDRGDMSQRDMARYVGRISEADICKILKCDRTIGLKRVVRVALALGIPVDMTAFARPLAKAVGTGGRRKFVEVREDEFSLAA